MTDFAKLGRLSRHMGRRKIESAHLSLTQPQRVAAAGRERNELWRDGNRLGKSEFLARFAVWCARGEHPFWGEMPIKPPVTVAVGGVTIDQMEPMTRKLWNLLPKDEIDPRFTYDPGRGITGKPPRIPFIAGPGKGSLIVLFTYKQGPQRIAGRPIHYGILDEPPPEEQWEEVLPRFLDTGGYIRIGMTPTESMPPQLYMKDLVAKGFVHEHNFGLAEEHCWPEASPAPYIMQSEIDEFSNGLRPSVRAMRMRGAWEGGVEGRRIPAFSGLNIRNDAPLARAKLGVGIDHGLQSAKQTAYLSAVWGGIATKGVLPRFWTLNGYIGEGESSTAEDAKGILDMIDSVVIRGQRLSWHHVDYWTGDRSVGTGRKGAWKSNGRLRAGLVTEIARRERRDDADSPWADRAVVDEHFPTIDTPDKRPGSVGDDCDFLNALLASEAADGTPCGIVHEHLTSLHEAVRRWKGGAREPFKDRVDGWRYGIMAAIDDAARESVVATYSL